MSDFDSFNNSDRLPADHLLDELESIKDILDDDDAALLDIPLLDDMVINNLNANSQLLNLGQIFEEDTEGDEKENADTDIDEQITVAASRAQPDVQFPRFSLDTLLHDKTPEPIIAAAIIPAASIAATVFKPSTHPAQRVRPDYSREVLVQELVDEFIPQIEAALRERLSQLDDATLKRWKESE
ncbi:MAG: hypothetical protein JWM78_732 [Verrucomicrobiaceae bacterium]|nr:hypothetical protein [Verrucomicrobiaceae bacterium]